MSKINFKNSLKWHERAKKVIPLGTQTYSKSYVNYTVGGSPLFISRGKGSHLWDVDGNEYIDYPMSLGSIILGHNYPAVSRAVNDQIKRGTIFSLASTLEVELAEKLCKIIPSVEMVRYGKNGSDATSGAVRLARAYTKKSVVAVGGYHGWQDWYIGTTSKNLGVPKEVQKLSKKFTYGKIETLEKIFRENKNNVAAVILEPVAQEGPDKKFLKEARELVDKNGAVLIYDEILSGFRYNLGGIETTVGISPDLICFGKALANGYPLSVIGGRKRIMRLLEDVFFSFTFGGETLSLIAALATLEVMKNEPVFEKINQIGEQLKNAYNKIVKELDLEKHTVGKGYKSRYYNLFFKKDGSEDLIMKSVYQQEMAKNGVIFHSGNNICYSHSAEDVQKTIIAYRRSLEVIKKAIEEKNLSKILVGKPIGLVFR